MNKSFVLTTMITILLICSTSLIPNISAMVSKNNINKNNLQYSNSDTKYWAILIGFEKYEDNSLMAAAYNPAYYIYDALCNSSAWEKENIFLLNDEKGTKQNILNSLEDMSKKIGPNDVFFFYFVSHGSQIEDKNGDEDDGKDEIIAPYDIKKEGGILNGLIGGELVNYITDDMIDEKLDNIHCKGICLIFDSCYCGGFVGGKNDVDTGPNRIVITASNIEEGSTLAGNNGDCFATRLTLAFYDNLTDKDDNGISVEELYDKGEELWFKSINPWISLSFYLMYIKALFKTPFSLLFVYMIAGGRLPKPWPFPAIYDGYKEGNEKEELIIIPKS